MQIPFRKPPSPAGAGLSHHWPPMHTIRSIASETDQNRTCTEHTDTLQLIEKM
jgi:hypothetical protein